MGCTAICRRTGLSRLDSYRILLESLKNEKKNIYFFETDLFSYDARRIAGLLRARQYTGNSQR